MAERETDDAREHDLVVLNAEVVNASGRFKGSVGVHDGRIATLAQGPLRGRKVVDGAA